MSTVNAVRSHHVGQSERVRMLIRELGSTRLTRGNSADFDETLVIAQMQGERPASFAARAIERIAAVERSSGRLGAATLQTGDRHDGASAAARRLIGLALARHARSHGGIVELVLEARGDSDQRMKQELLELVELLLGAVAGVAPVRLRFEEASLGEAEQSSGVFWSGPPQGS